ncbi:SWR1 complex subunit 6-like isoform X3 [Durio zibethinus]|uniref:SWR1 complex subunit 6-like isoform X3 n=1 Tax=Durio zibethinus TaxID=66656 RepID=A0A6P5ZSX0_DURZI|nr:SWR1 complex subunit 6-like isoform X3 [Durio zibethinus]
MDDDNSNAVRRMSSRTRKVAPKMAAALGSSDNRTQAALARLEALENDNAGIETIEMNDDDEASLDDEDQAYMQKKSKGTKRKTRQAKALENARKAPRTFLELLNEWDLQALPPAGISAAFVGLLQAIHVSRVGCAFVHAVAKMYISILDA